MNPFKYLLIAGFCTFWSVKIIAQTTLSAGDIVIVSMVRSNTIAGVKGQEPDFISYPELGYSKQDSLGFAEFPNRLNVALSRAKRLLIIVGNATHFCKQEV